MSRKSSAVAISKPLLKLDLGCGQRPQEGFTGVDVWSGANIVHDLFTFPWPFEAGSVEEVYSSHFLEHVPGSLRFKFFDELHRILIVGGKVSIIVPYWSSCRAIQDPTHQWPPISESSFAYYNKKWREDNKLDHYDVHCDFDFVYGYAYDNETAARSTETQQFWSKHYVNAVADLHITLTKRDPKA